jgi:hypothetical protein
MNELKRWIDMNNVLLKPVKTTPQENNTYI